MSAKASPDGAQGGRLPAAVVFDMDGVMVDSELQWKLCEGEFFRELAPSWTEDDHERIVGLSPLDCYKFLRDRCGMTHSRERFLELCDALARRIYLERVTLAPGLLGFLDRLAAAKLPLAIASSSPRPWIDLVLQRFGLAARFSAVAAGDEVGGRTKPHPDLYALAVLRLGKPAAACLAIEDSAVGVRAAKAAGLRCAAYRNGHNAGQELSAADLAFASFEGFDLQALAGRPA